ncbi:MAG TPA: SoxR reducing system RseC family protein [Nitrospirota bacterium]|nr:SoxR reducing system RseC family protein [Nitrospirota bacterium]
MDNSMIEEGIVVSVSDGMARVRSVRGSSCGGCSSRSMCKPSESSDVIIEAKNDVGAHVGERVEIVVGAKTFLKASFISYMFPLITFFIGAIIGKYIGGSDVWAAMSGMFTMFFCFYGVWLYNKKLQGGSKYHPVIKTVLSP